MKQSEQEPGVNSTTAAGKTRVASTTTATNQTSAAPANNTSSPASAVAATKVSSTGATEAPAANATDLHPKEDHNEDHHEEFIFAKAEHEWFMPDTDYVPAEKPYVNLRPSMSKTEKLVKSTRNIMGATEWGKHINAAFQKHGLPDVKAEHRYYTDFLSKACVFAKFDEVLGAHAFKASHKLRSGCQNGKWLDLIQKDPDLRSLHWLYSMNENKGLEKGFRTTIWTFDEPAGPHGYLDR